MSEFKKYNYQHYYLLSAFWTTAAISTGCITCNQCHHPVRQVAATHILEMRELKLIEKERFV